MVIRETFAALQAINIPDDKILAVVEALEKRDQFFRDEMHAMKRDIAILKWLTGAILAALPILKLFAK